MSSRQPTVVDRRSRPPVDVVMIGGGPAGCASARLLASWGHRVRLVTRDIDVRRGLAESLPPSTHKLLAEIGVLDAIERAGFYRSTGNTVYWASREPRVETFRGVGFQVFRPELDRILIDQARRAGVEICRSTLTAEAAARDADLVLDCSGRAGVVARRFRIAQREHRTAALVGVWRRDADWPLPDQTHTVVETFDQGWAWSVPTEPRVRHVGVMVDRGAAYEQVLASTHAMRALVEGADLVRTFACDASLYRSERYAGPGFFLVGDAGSFIDPLSSFGVKKALASAWVAAVAAHTALVDASRATIAASFFDAWERRMYAEHLRRSRDFARRAVDAHPTAFWSTRAAVVTDEPDAADDLADDAADVRDAFGRIRAADDIAFALAADVRVDPQPVIRRNEIVLEPAFRPVTADGAGAPLRFHDDVDLVALADIACRHRRVPDVYDVYCRTCAPAPLPNVVAGLSLLVAKGILHART